MSAAPAKISPGDCLVCFDLGRVLVRICDNWQHACRVAGMTAPVAELSAEQAAKLHEFVCQSEMGEIDQDTFAQSAAALLNIKPDDVFALTDAYLLGAYDGVPELIDQLTSAGIPTACLSNTNAAHWQAMSDRSHAHGLPLDQLTYRFASHLIGLRKPDDAIYEHVERETGLKGNAILFFDDLEENILAAHRRGWRAKRVLVDHDPISQIRRALAEEKILAA